MLILLSIVENKLRATECYKTQRRTGMPVEIGETSSGSWDAKTTKEVVISQSRLVTDQNRPITTDLCHLSLTANNMMAKLTSKVTQTRLSTFKWPQPFTWLWWWLLHRLSWHQSPLATTVLLSTTLSHFLHSGNLNVWFKSNIVRRNKILVTIDPLTPASDQDRISPYNIYQISDEIKEKYQFQDS